MKEKPIGAVKHIGLERVERNTVEQIVDVRSPRIQKRIGEVSQFTLRRRIDDHVTG